jgi:hypothetical protein
VRYLGLTHAREETSKSEIRDNSEDQRCMLGWRDDVHVDLQPFIYVMRFHPRRYEHSQKSWVILLMNIHKPNRVIYDVYLCGAEIEKKMHIIFFIYIFLFRGEKKGGGAMH